MHLSSLMNDDFITIVDSVKSKEEALSLILSTIKKKYNGNFDEKNALAKILEREALASTNFDNLISIPHARIDGFNDFIIGVAILKNEIILDEKPIRMIVLILTGKSESKLYLNTLASFVKMSRDKDLFESLLNIKDEEEFVSIVEKTNYKVKDEIDVEDIMSKDIVSICAECTLKELLDIMSRHKISYIPVTDKDGNFIGELNTGDIVKLGIPSYAAMVGNLSFLSNFEPFEDLLKNEDEIKVKEILRKPTIKVTPSTSIIELAFKCTQSGRRHVSVEENGKLVGIVSIHDIINKVLRG